VTVGSNGHPEKYGLYPENIRIEKYIPQSYLLPYCDAVRQVQKEMKNLPPLAGAVKRLESLAKTGAPQVVENKVV
jgi:hypothetical protein